MCFSDNATQELIRAAVEARKFAHCPYSNFQVGAALLTKENETYSGCNVENVAYPVGVCAERTACCKAISEGKHKFEAMAIVAESEKITTPCGMCRQFLAEFGNFKLYCCQPKLDNVLVTDVSQLLPFPFYDFSQ